MIFLILYYLIDIRKPFLGVITILPVVAIVMGTYLGMYFLDIPLNPVTSTLSGLAIGIGVPFVIHVTNRFRETLLITDSPVDAVRTTLKTTGGSLFGSAFTTMAGFGILMTSSLKPFQAAASIKSGAIDSANFCDKEIALMCASHQGEKDHINTAKSMLEKLNLSVENYECGSHLPSNKKVQYDMIQQEIPPSPLHNNCSGKHAGMLALGTYLGKGVNGYTKKNIS